MIKRISLVITGLTAMGAVALGSGVAQADPYLPHVPGLPGGAGWDIGLPPPGHINQWLPPPGQVKQWIPGPEDFVPNWR